LDAERPKPVQRAELDPINAVSAAKAATVAGSEGAENVDEDEMEELFNARDQAEFEEEMQTDICTVSGLDWLQRLELGVCDDTKEGCTHDRCRVGCSRYFGTQRQNGWALQYNVINVVGSTTAKGSTEWCECAHGAVRLSGKAERPAGYVMPDGTDMPRCEKTLCVEGLTAWYKWFKHAEKRVKTAEAFVETAELWRIWRRYEKQLAEASVKPGGFTEETQLWKAARCTVGLGKGARADKAHVGAVQATQGPQRRPSILLKHNVCRDDQGRIVDEDRLKRHQEAMTIEAGTIRSNVPNAWNGKINEEHGDSVSVTPSGVEPRKRRIEMMLNGDEKCRYSRGWTNSRWCTRVDPDAERQLFDERNEWAHYERGTGPAELGITTYGDQCATAAGNTAPVVANKLRADVVEDTIELYILDLAMHERLPIGYDTDAYEEDTIRRSLAAGEGMDSSINHGHFRKWRICVEKHCTAKGKTAFWTADMGSGDSNKQVWNKALRASQSFTRATDNSPSPKVARFNLLRNRVHEDQRAEILITAVTKKNTEGEMSGEDADEIAKLRDVQQRNRTVGINEVIQVMTYAHKGEWHVAPAAEAIKEAVKVESVNAVTATTVVEIEEDRSSPWHKESDARNLFFGEPSTDDKAVVMNVRRAEMHTGGSQSHTIANVVAIKHAIKRLQKRGRKERKSQAQQERISLDGLESLLHSIEVDDCEMVVGDTRKIAAQYQPKAGDVVIEDTARYPGLIMYLHSDMRGATFTVDARIRQWSRRGAAGMRRDSAPGSINAVQTRSSSAAAAQASGWSGPDTGVSATRTKAQSETVFEEHMPEFAPKEMRDLISKTILRLENHQKIKKLIDKSGKLCNDQHKFDPSEFDMENAMRINLKLGKEAPPPEFRKQGHHMLEIISAQIKEMEEAGWIYRGESTTACPLLVVRKPTEPGAPRKWRITSDFRELNSCIQNAAYPLPEVTETIRGIREQACESHRQDLANNVKNPDIPKGVDPEGHDPGVSFISVADLSKAFYHMPVHEDDRYLTAFNVPGLGTWLYAAAPMGIKTTPSKWNEFLSKKLRRHGVLYEPGLYDEKKVLDVPDTKMDDGKPAPHSYIQVYIDDIIIVSASQETHVRAWEHLIKVLVYEGLALTKPKIEIGVKYLRYLGHIISHTEVFSDPKKVEAIRDLPKPRTKKDVRCFLGMINYYRPYILNFGETASVLTALTTDLFGRDISKEWDANPKYDAAMQRLIDKMCQYPILRMPDLSRPWIVVTDASAVALGAALCQEYDGKLAVVEFASRALIPAERDYTATERECLATKWAMERWRLYLLGGTGNRIRFSQRKEGLEEVQQINERDKLSKASRRTRVKAGRRFDTEYVETGDPKQAGVTAKTDHSALIPLKKKKQINNQRLAHWVTTMSEFEYECEYVPGDSATLDVPDCLSRLIKPERLDGADAQQSDKFLYSSSWTSVYATLFDRLKEENRVNALTVEGSASDEVLPSGSVPNDMAQHGCDEDDPTEGTTEYVVDWNADVMNHVSTYGGCDIAEEWTQMGGHTCDGEQLCGSFQEMYHSEFKCGGGPHYDHFGDSGQMERISHLQRVDQMRRVPQINCAVPIDLRKLSSDAQCPTGTAHTELQAEYEKHSRSLERREQWYTKNADTDDVWNVCTLMEGERRGNWYRTAEKEQLSDIACKNDLTSHKLVLLNEEFNSKNEGGWLNDWPTANRELKRSPQNPEGDPALTRAGTERVYNRKMKADTWLRLVKDAKFDEVEAETVAGSKVDTQVPRIEFQADEMSGRVKLLDKQDYHEHSTDAHEERAREAEANARDEQAATSAVEKENSRTSRFDKQKANAARRCQREATRVMPTTYAEMYRRACENSSNAEASVAVSDNPYFRLRDTMVEVRKNGLHTDWLVVVPTAAAQAELVNRAHTMGESHPNGRAMFAELRTRYYWKGMLEACERKCRECSHCQRQKSRVRLPAGKLATVEEPTSMGLGYSIDFLTKLPSATIGRFDTIMNVQDRWSRRVFAIPCRATSTARQCARLFYEEICVHMGRGLPNFMQMDRDPRFVAAFYQEFFRICGVHLHFTTGYRSQSNGLIENTNKAMSALLRTDGIDQRSWWARRKLAVHHLNTMKRDRLGGRSAIEAETGIRPRGVLDIDPNILTRDAQGHTVVDSKAVQGSQGDRVKAHLDSLLAMQSEMEEARRSAQEMMLDIANRRYQELKKATMEAGQMVMVEAKYISVPAKKVKGLGFDSEKLQPRWFGPYKVRAWHNECDVEIQKGGADGLHPKSRVHPVFHQSKVKPYSGPTKPRPLLFENDEKEESYAVKEIISHRGQRAGEKATGSRSTREYLVAWDGFNVEDFTWEKEKDVLAKTPDDEGADELVEEYFARLRHEKSRQVSRDDGTAELTDAEIDEMADTMHVGCYDVNEKKNADTGSQQKWVIAAMMGSMSMTEAHSAMIEETYGQCWQKRKENSRLYDSRATGVRFKEECQCNRCSDAVECKVTGRYEWYNRHTDDWQPQLW
jgi:hypothetical protein